MQTLASLLSAASVPAAGSTHGEFADLGKGDMANGRHAFDPEDSAFDDVMSQALSGQPALPTHPAAAKTPSLLTRVSAAPTAVTAKAGVSFLTDATSVLSSDSGTDAPKTGAKIAAKKSADAGDAKTSATTSDSSPDPAPLLDNSQNLPIQLLAPALSTYLLTSASGTSETGQGLVTSGGQGNGPSGGQGGVMAVMASTTAAKSTTLGSTTLLPGLTQPGGENQSTDAGPVTAVPSQPKPQDPAADITAKAGGFNLDQLASEPVQTARSTPAVRSAAPGKSLAIQPTPAKDAALPATNTAEARADSSTPAKIAGTDLPPATVETAPETPETPANSGLMANLTSYTPVQTHGTVAAKQDVPMKNAENTIKVAGPGEKVLPGNALVSARANSVSVKGTSAGREGNAGSNNIIPLSAAAESHAGAASNTDTVAVSNLTDIRTRAVDRTQDMVALHAIRLVDSKSDSLSVVLKPGAGIQLSLQLTQGADGIQAQAVLQHGDFQDLNQRWPELQNRLEQRGIKLAPLASDENAMSFANQNRGQQNRQQPPEEKALFASAFAEFSLAGAMTGATPSPALAALTAGGWQSWA